MWDTVLTTYREVSNSAEKQYLVKAKSRASNFIDAKVSQNTGYNCTQGENDKALSALRARTWLAMRKKLEEQTTDAAILATLRNTFEERFRYDEQGVPRVWRPEDDLEAAFRKAKDEVNYSCESHRSIGLG